MSNKQVIAGCLIERDVVAIIVGVPKVCCLLPPATCLLLRLNTPYVMASRITVLLDGRQNVTSVRLCIVSCLVFVSLASVLFSRCC